MYKDIIKGWVKHLDFMLLDIFCLELSFIITYLLRQNIPENGMPKLYQNLMGMILVLDVCAVFFCNSYSEIIRRGYLVELKKTLIHCGFVELGIIVWMFFIKQSSEYSRAVIFAMYPVSVCLVLGGRLFWKRVIRLQRKYKKDRRKILIVTTKENAEAAVKGLLEPYRDYELKAVVIYDDPSLVGKEICHIPVVADKNGMFDYIQEHVVDEVFIDFKNDEKTAERLMNFYVNIGLVAHVNLTRFSDQMKNHKVYTLGDFTVLSSGMKIAAFRQIFFKRALDICGALVGLVIAGAAVLIFGPVIYKQSPGPIFFSQERVARNGRVFKIYKLRTMYPDAEERKKELMKHNKMQGLMFKMDNDPRIIPIGHFLRKSSIDELPQFWNVLKGEMSLVGTRPPTLDEFRQYDMGHRKRLAMKPGLTGMWQISGRSDIVDFEEIVALDAKYIEEWTLSMDIKILWKTVKIVLAGKGAV